jgi:hypothetical protein
VYKLTSISLEERISLLETISWTPSKNNKMVVIIEATLACKEANMEEEIRATKVPSWNWLRKCRGLLKLSRTLKLK